MLLQTNSLKSSSAFPSSGLNITWDADLPNTIRALTNNTINKNIDNLTKQMEDENSLITKQTLSNVTFYQFTPLDITRTLLNETINNLVDQNQTLISPGIGINQTSQVGDLNQTTTNKTGSKLPPAATVSSEPIDIVIVDTGVSLTHPDLSVYRSLSFVNGNLSSNSNITDDQNGHGSHIAGIINAKDNGFGIVGIVPEDNIRIWSLKVCGDDGICSLSDQIKAIEYITKNADILDIVNYSIENPYSKLFEQAISESVKAGITYVAAAGNFAKNATLTTSPASNPDVITVSAIGDSDGKCGGLGPLLDGGRIMDDTFGTFSNFGPSIDVAAPGVDILSTFNGTAYGILTGTSMAVPHVTGLAGYLKTINPDASPDEIREMIIKSGSSPSSQCQENKGIGYFKGDLDDIPEPLVILPKNLVKDDSIIGIDATNNIKTNVTKQELPTTPTKTLPTIKKQQHPPIVEPQTPSKTNVTKQELPTTPTKTNVTKQELPTLTKTLPTIKKQEPQTPSKTNATKQELPTTPTKTNATKEELPTTPTKTLPTIKKQQQPPIVEPKTPSKTNVTKQELPTTTKTNVTKQELPTTPTKTLPTIKKQEPQTPSKTNATKQELPTTPTKTLPTIKKQEPQTPSKTNVTKQELPTTPTKTNATKEELPTTPTKTLPTIKKQQHPPIVEPQTPSKTNVTKQELPTTTKTNVTKQELPTTPTKTLPTIKKQEPQIPSKTNVTKQELPTTPTKTLPTIKKQQHPPIVEPQTPSKTNVTKQELPTTTKTNVTKQELPTTPTKTLPTIKKQEPQTPSKTNVTKQELPTTPTKTLPTIKKQEPQTPSKTNVTKQELPTTPTKTLPTIKKQEPQTPSKTNVTKQELPTTPTKTNATKEELTTTPTKTLPTIKKQQQPPIVEPKTSNQTTNTPTQLSNNTSNNTAANVIEDKINLAIENLSVERSVTNSVVIKGDIKNNSTLDLQEIKVSAEYYDKTGTLLANVEHFITSPSYILKPNKQVSFDILEVLGFGFHKLGDYNIVPSGETIN